VALKAVRKRADAAATCKSGSERQMQSETPNPELELGRGVDFGEFQLAYQPVVDLNDGSVVCVEALLRWDHPTRGLLWPGEFLDRGDADVRRRVTRWVLSEAGRWAAHWRRRFPDRPITVAVNLSAEDLDSSELATALAKVTRANQLDPGALAFEIGEAALFSDVERARTRLLAFRDLGVQLFVDDFGTAYSSVVSSLETMPADAVYVLPESVGTLLGEAHDGILMSLASIESLPIDVVKVDRRFVQRLFADGKDSTLVESVVRLAHRLGFKVLAEGVEHDNEAMRLRDVGCDLGQGYYFHRPQTREYVDVILREALRERAADPPIPASS
jgi:EAL domain-containing protein (putative c-di-GMP-specific phosphodiesterase class I)